MYAGMILVYFYRDNCVRIMSSVSPACTFARDVFFCPIQRRCQIK